MLVYSLTDLYEFYASYVLTKKFDDTKNSFCQGTTMQAINNTNIKNIRIAKPAKNIALAYSSLTQTMFQEMEALKYENSKTNKIRDKLLPKLMNGEIDLDEY